LEIKILKIKKNMKAIWNGAIIAESDKTINIEGNPYFPLDSVNKEYLSKNEMHSVCPWKGRASYYDIVVNEKTNKDAAWYYPEPKALASKIKDYVAFWKGVEVKN
jgi:uncharacterized protein (DUF427 family)